MKISELLHLPELASAHGYEIDMVIFLIHVLMVILFVGWGIFFIYTLIRFNKRNQPKADYHGVKSHTSTYLEIGVVVFEALLLIGFSIPFWSKQVNAFPDRPDAIEVRVIAEQFAWNVHYPGEDGVFGKADWKFFNKQSNPLGLDPDDPHGKDDITTINQLNLPIGRPVIVHLTSKDVIHSFFLPEMRVKQDAMPGMSVPTWFTPTKLGKYEIACAQLCGLGHYRMKGYMTIMRQDEYDAWLEEEASYLGGGDEGFDDFWN